MIYLIQCTKVLIAISSVFENIFDQEKRYPGLSMHETAVPFPTSELYASFPTSYCRFEFLLLSNSKFFIGRGRRLTGFM